MKLEEEDDKELLIDYTKKSMHIKQEDGTVADVVATVDLPISKGTGNNTLVINEGIATGKYSIASGSTDKSVVEDITGIDITSVSDSIITEALGPRGIDLKQLVEDYSKYVYIFE